MTRLVNIRYLTGFTGSAGLLLVGPDEVLFVSDGRYRDQAADQLAAAGGRHGGGVAVQAGPHLVGGDAGRCVQPGLAGVEQLSGIETHDCFTTSEYMAIDHFGITKPGESWKAIEEGAIEMGGKIPMNPSGGLIGVGHPVGCSGVRQMLDCYRQVTGTAGDYQVEGAERFAMLNIGGSGTTSCAFVVGKH